MAEQPYEFALVMAGAVTAGAYTAGVLDFLFEALDAWEKEKKAGNPNVPTHDVKLSVVTGASAGSMCAAFIGTLADRSFEHVKSPKTYKAGTNPMYEAWVEMIDLNQLLKTDDLKDKDKKVKSLLNATALDTIRDVVFARNPDPSLNIQRDWISDNLPIYLTLTNLRGVPYGLAMDKTNIHGMTLHADRFHTVVKADQAHPAADLVLDSSSHPAQWMTFANAAIASGAFPVGLSPRLVTLPRDNYKTRPWSDALGSVPLEPLWPNTAGGNYRFVTVDGGVINNEPLDIARAALDGFGKSTPKLADRSVILIDPFPDVPSTQKEYDKYDAQLDNTDLTKPDNFDEAMSLLGTAGAIINAMKDQGRFKAQDLIMAARENVHNRYLIGPKPGIASGAISGFGGAISKEFREYDFMLGRKNCQQFLREEFALTLKNEIIEDGYKNITSPGVIDEMKYESAGKNYRPIIPLVTPELREPIEVGDIPKLSKERAKELRGLLSERLETVVPRLFGELLGGVAVVEDILLTFGHDIILNRLMSAMFKQLSNSKQWDGKLTYSEEFPNPPPSPFPVGSGKSSTGFSGVPTVPLTVKDHPKPLHVPGHGP